MKNIKMLLLSCIVLIGLNIRLFSQDTTLPGVTVVSLNYKYLKSVNDPNSSQPVRLLEHRAASYDIKNTDYYEDEYDEYIVSFFIPEGEILATYDKNGKLLRTAERFKNVALPSAVRNAVSSRYPEWSIYKDIYKVNYYHDNSSNAKKIYKLLLENGDERMRVKTTEQGDFIK